MPALLTIGEFSRASYLTIKTLRHYHDVGLLEPAQVDSSSGYRFYRADQLATAQTIRRLRELEMPVEQVKGVLQAADAGERNALIADHLERMEQRLEQATAAVASLRALLREPEGSTAVEFRAVPPTPALSTIEVVVSAVMDSHGELGCGYGHRPGASGNRYLVRDWLLRRAGPIPGRARPEGRRARSRVLPGRPASHRRRQPMADRDRLAGRADAPMRQPTGNQVR